MSLAPGSFAEINPKRPPSDFLHFGFSLPPHVDRAIVHLMLKPLLLCNRPRRAPGSDGRLFKNGVFAEKLVVLFD